MELQGDLILNLSDVFILEVFPEIEYRIAIIGMHQIIPLGLHN